MATPGSGDLKSAGQAGRQRRDSGLKAEWQRLESAAEGWRWPRS
jgi:hypothetical protein